MGASDVSPEPPGPRSVRPMACDVSNLSIAEIRRRFLQGEEPVTRAILTALDADPRAGVRQVRATLRRRREREHRELRRIEALLQAERELWEAGLTRVAGVDEAGVGPLAGPVVAAAVVFPPGTAILGVDDSKKITDPERREELAREIEGAATSWAVGVADVADIDRLNVYHAALLAMRRAVEGLSSTPEHLLVDAREIAGLDIPQRSVEKGDSLHFSIAAASILAKTHRDRMMVELDRRHPEYGFARHKGYGTEAHQEAIREHGPCSAHRMSYQAIHELCGELSELFYRLRDRLDRSTSPGDLACLEDEVTSRREALSDGEYRRLRALAARRRSSL